jgi:hypothetical protein
MIDWAIDISFPTDGAVINGALSRQFFSCLTAAFHYFVDAYKFCHVIFPLTHHCATFFKYLLAKTAMRLVGSHARFK